MYIDCGMTRLAALADSIHNRLDAQVDIYRRVGDLERQAKPGGTV